MFAGHALLAFALAAGAASLAGCDADRALAVGVLAGVFGLAPDVDILYAPVGLAGAASLPTAETAFWATGNIVHRTATHSLVVGGAADDQRVGRRPVDDVAGRPERRLRRRETGGTGEADRRVEDVDVRGQPEDAGQDADGERTVRVAAGQRRRSGRQGERQEGVAGEHHLGFGPRRR